MAIGCGGTERGTLDGVDEPLSDGPEPVLECEPALANFGAVLPGERATLEIACLNPGDESMVWGSAELTHTTSDDFRIVEASVPRGGRIGPATEGGRVTVRVEYGPGSLGDDEGEVEVWVWRQGRLAPEPRVAARVWVLGSGGGPSFEVTPAQMNFPPAPPLEPRGRTVALTNVGFDDLEVLDISVETEGPIRAELDSASAFVLPMGESTGVTSRYWYVGSGAFSLRFHFETRDPDPPLGALVFSGTAPPLEPCAYELSSDDVDFGGVRVGDSAEGDVEVRNLGDVAGLVSAVALGPDSDAAFVIEIEPEPFLVPAGEIVTLPVRFRSSGPRRHRGTLEMAFANPEMTEVVWLVGEGVDDGS